jgi:hypothetical protein
LFYRVGPHRAAFDFGRSGLQARNSDGHGDKYEDCDSAKDDLFPALLLLELWAGDIHRRLRMHLERHS